MPLIVLCNFNVYDDYYYYFFWRNDDYIYERTMVFQGCEAINSSMMISLRKINARNCCTAFSYTHRRYGGLFHMIVCN